MLVFYYFNRERNYDVLNSRNPCILLNKNINFNKSKTESKMENPTHSFRETNHVLQLIQSKTDKLEFDKGKRGHFFVLLILSEGHFS